MREQILGPLQETSRPEATRACASFLRAAARLWAVLGGRSDRTKDLLARAVARQRKTLEAMSHCSEASGEWMQAIEDYRQILPGRREHADALLGQSLLYVAAGLDLRRRGLAGRACFQKALGLLPSPGAAANGHPAARLLEALILVALDRPSDALGLLSQAAIPLPKPR